MTPSQGVKPPYPYLVCKLQKLLYGLKRASREWNAKLTSFLIAQGFLQSKNDYTLFTKRIRGCMLILLVYVDDVIVACEEIEAIEDIKDKLHSEFQIENLVNLKYFLGIEVARSHKGLFIKQRKYTIKLLEEMGFLGSKPVVSPTESHVKLMHNDSEFLEDITHYRKLVGQLIYLTITRPDISYIVQQLSQFLDRPTINHLKAGHRLLRYLKGTVVQGLLFPNTGNMRLKGFVDSDWLDVKRQGGQLLGIVFF